MTDTAHIPPRSRTAPVHIRPIRPDEAEDLLHLRHQAIRECAHWFGTPPTVELAKDTAHYRRRLLNCRRGGRSALLGVWTPHGLRGMAGVRSGRDEGVPYGLIYSMYLTPDWRGHGLGRDLLAAAIDHIRAAWRINTFRMNVEVHNTRALALYQACGFDILRTETRAFRIDGAWYDVYLLETRTPDPS